MRKQILQAVKSLWLILIFAAVGLYIAGNFDEIVAQFSSLSLSRVVLVLVLIVVGRLLLVRLSLESVGLVGWSPPYRRMLLINSLSQLAKYLPGGVWHFVGRAGYYHSDGLTLPDVTRAMVMENVWLVSSAGFVGSILMIVYVGGAFSIFAVLILMFSWFIILLIITRRYTPQISIIRVSEMLLLQWAIWLILSASFVVILPQTPTPATLPLVLGAFLIGWLVGFLALFAPGGFGIREGVLVALLLPLLSSSETLDFALLHRLLWTVAELLLGIFSWTFLRDS